jgi:predicted nucleic acid-binding protein
MDLLLDTNVMIDYFAAREPYYEQMKQLKAMAYFGEVKLWGSSNSFTDVFYVMNKANDTKTVQKAFLASKDYLSICSVNGEDVYQTCEQGWADFEDCLVAVCADKIKADFIITRDISGFKLSKIPSLTPGDFLEMIREKRGISYAELPLP